RAAQFRDALSKVLDRERRIGTAKTVETLPVDVLQRLGALGYVSGGAATTSTPGADPKDKILEFRRANDSMRRGLLALNRRDYSSAAQIFEELIGSGIESFEAHLYLARALSGLQQPDRAAAHFEQAAQRAPLLEDAWTGLADARLATRGPDAALATVREAR